MPHPESPPLAVLIYEVDYIYLCHDWFQTTLYTRVLAIRTWLVIIVEYHRVAHDRLGETVGRCLGLFNADDGMVGSRGVYWLQHAINVLVGLF